MDIGVHKYYSVDQNIHCFDVDFNEHGVILLVNSNEQIFVEKLKSLLIFGENTTRFKDIYDIYYLLPFLNRNKITIYTKILIFDDKKIRENDFKSISKQIRTIFKNALFLSNLKSSRKNWTNTSTEIVLSEIISYLNKLK